MLSILIISHSDKIAEGTKILASQMMQAPLDIRAIGGTADGDIGTDVDAIEKAIKDINKEDGVLVLADLGSAVMSFDMVYEWLDDEVKAKIRLADAPLVEGAVMGAVEASLGKDMEAVLKTIESREIIKKNNS
ncbi:dihydroxyacetone kinase phosphoryl donor subunit DhaM [Halanaerobium kushneri]|uniref:dihydroxyacetone kinase phosphoryl donor subunit DhaM n=1 Tax=Halanaerobium kushneri TaxID=56779 RepID=UPI000970D715|nr:dihydroxyacetone kinase phosphoryl donor subunit DhaM [Halanaerobium kushneri]